MSIKYHHDLSQNTPEWYDIRLGIVTASEMNTILTPTGKQAKGEKIMSYASEIFAQRNFESKEESFQSFAMQMGHVFEPHARQQYSDNYAEVHECGFITRDFGEFKIGASPDGLVGDDGLIEIKTRASKFQVKTLLDDEVPKEFVNQIQTLLLITDRKWADFVSFSNGMELFVKRVYPDLELQEKIKYAVKGIEELVEMIAERYKTAAKKFIKTDYVDILMADDIVIGGE